MSQSFTSTMLKMTILSVVIVLQSLIAVGQTSGSTDQGSRAQQPQPIQLQLQPRGRSLDLRLASDDLSHLQLEMGRNQFLFNNGRNFRIFSTQTGESLTTFNIGSHCRSHQIIMLSSSAPKIAFSCTKNSNGANQAIWIIKRDGEVELFQEVDNSTTLLKEIIEDDSGHVYFLGLSGEDDLITRMTFYVYNVSSNEFISYTHNLEFPFDKSSLNNYRIIHDDKHLIFVSKNLGFIQINLNDCSTVNQGKLHENFELTSADSAFAPLQMFSPSDQRWFFLSRSTMKNQEVQFKLHFIHSDFSFSEWNFQQHFSMDTKSLTAIPFHHQRVMVSYDGSYHLYNVSNDEFIINNAPIDSGVIENFSFDQLLMRPQLHSPPSTVLTTLSPKPESNMKYKSMIKLELTENDNQIKLTTFFHNAVIANDDNALMIKKDEVNPETNLLHIQIYQARWVVEDNHDSSIMSQ